MQKEKIRNSILGILAFVLLFYEIIVLKGENYYLVSMAVLLIALFGFFAHFEKERPGVMLLTMIASLCALAIAGRIAFFFLPQIKPIAAVVILAGVSFGGEVGFVTGALSAFVSNFYFGQGSWTPFQMVALGLVGFFAGVFFYGRESKRWLVALYGFFAVVIIYGAIVDLNTIFLLHSSFPYRWFVLCICQDFLLTCCLEQRLPDFCSVCINPFFLGLKE